MERVIPGFVVVQKIGGYRYQIENAKVQLMSWEDSMFFERLAGRTATIFDTEELADEMLFGS